MTPPARRVAAGVAGVVVLVAAANLLARGADEVVGGREPGGRPGSSYATAPSGLAAYADLLARNGVRVTRQRGPLDAAALDATATVFMTATDGVRLGDDDLRSLRSFAERGGRVVVGNAGAVAVRTVTGHEPEVGPGTDRYGDVAADLAPIETVLAAGGRAYRFGAGGDPLVRAGDLVLAARFGVGAGTVVVLADTAPIENRLLAAADNAAFAIELAGGTGTTAVFAEGVHGFGTRRGLGALPARWKVTLWGLAGTAIVFAWARSRRIGPPDRPDRELPPARARYVGALGATLAQSRDPSTALAGLAAAARSTLAARAGLAHDASPDALERAARALGADDAEIAVLNAPPQCDAEVIALGRLAARAARSTASEGEAR